MPVRSKDLAKRRPPKVVVLCGGQGTRLREQTEYVPKPMVLIGERPILWHILKHFQVHGSTEFVLCLGYKGDQIKRYFLDYRADTSDFTLELGKPDRIRYHQEHTEADLTVTLANTGHDSMTGARVKRVQQHVGRDWFIVTYGDGVTDVDIGALLRFHRSHGKLATVTGFHPTSRFGVIEADPSGLVEHFAEKPQLDGLISCGYFVFEPAVMDYLASDASCVLETEPLSRLAHERQLMVFRHEGFFHGMDTYRDYLALNDLWARGEAPWKTW